MADAWPTADEPAEDDFIERGLSIPNDRQFLMAVSGALLPLCDPDNWEQINGELTPEECAAFMFTMYLGFLESGA